MSQVLNLTAKTFFALYIMMYILHMHREEINPKNEKRQRLLIPKSLDK